MRWNSLFQDRDRLKAGLQTFGVPPLGGPAMASPRRDNRLGPKARTKNVRTPAAAGTAAPLCAFTLIELMVVVAIIGIVITISIPTIYQQMHPESMRKAVSDVVEACSHARARAILNGVQT